MRMTQAGAELAERGSARQSRTGTPVLTQGDHRTSTDHEEPQTEDCCGGSLAQRMAMGPVDDAELFGEGGQQGFMAELRSRVTQACNEELAPSGRTANDCPYIAHWLGHYETVSASHLDRAIQRYAQPAGRSPEAYFEAVEGRVRSAVKTWAATGKVTGLPEDGRSSDTRLGDGSDLQGTLGSGRALDAPIRSKLEGSYGADLKSVRVHTGGRAASMAKQQSSLAFTVGSDIVFGSDRYRPGTLPGDALIAHEVAHTIQQGGTPHSTNEVSESHEASLEHEADAAAARAVTGQPAMITRGVSGRSGLKLQRCSSPDCTPHGPSGLRLDLEKKRKCGLLDPPFRPEDVGAFPVYAPEDDFSSRPLDPKCYPSSSGDYEPPIAALGPSPSVAALGFVQRQMPIPPIARPIPLPPIVRPIPIPPIARPIPIPPIARPIPVPPIARPIPVPPTRPIPAPPLEPPVGPSPLPRPPIPPVIPMPSQPQEPTTQPRPDDQRYLDRLTPQQKDYYQELRDAEQLKPPDRAENPDEVRDTEPQEPTRRRRRARCVEQDVPRLGGFVAHDQYASLKSQSDFDHFVGAPRGPKINYDGRTPGTTVVWEVKVGGGWMFNCDWQSVRELVLRRWDAQKDRGMAVAAKCNLSHIWACQHRGVARIVRDRWGGSPPVVT